MIWQEGDLVNMMNDTSEAIIVYDDCAGEMRKSFGSFSHCIQAWTVMSCPTTNSTIAKRIVLGE